MVATTPSIGKGTVVRVGRGAVPAWITLARVGDVTFPTAVSDELDATAQDSPGNSKEFIAGLTDNGVIDLPIQYLEGSPTDVLLRAIQISGEIIQLEITPKGGSPERWAAFCRQYSRTAPVNGIQMTQASFRVNGTI